MNIHQEVIEEGLQAATKGGQFMIKNVRNPEAALIFTGGLAEFLNVVRRTYPEATVKDICDALEDYARQRARPQ